MILPAIDAHAHVHTEVDAEELRDLDALVLAVTNRASEWDAVLARGDELTIWGVGVHPLLREELEGFSPEHFGEALTRSLFVAEVGLDRKTLSPLSRGVFDQVLGAVARQQRPVSIHSAGAAEEVLDALSREPIRAPILHWWRAGRAQTEAAIELGAYFSLNGAQARDPALLAMLPPERVLTETDFPHSRRRDSRADRPGETGTIEEVLASSWGIDGLELRRQVWRNLACVFESCELLDNLPETVQELIVAAGIL